jgi:heme/copper-type cytochrome/quinol oxidase subunit 4
MPQDAPQSDATAEVALAVRSLMPNLKRQATLAVAIITLTILAATVTAFLFLNSGMDGGDRWQTAFITGIVAFLVVSGVYKWTLRRQQAQVMPILARAIGLTYAKDAKAFIKALPKRLLPGRGIRKGEDHVHGTIGVHAIQMAEVTVETGGKNSRTLFKGIVAQFPNRTAMPAFFVALEDKTRPGFFFGGDLTTEGLHQLRTVTGSGGRRYGVWTSWSQQEEPPALSEVVTLLTRIEDLVGPAAELYAATSNGVEMHVALTHRRNLFHFGGLFPDENQLFRDVRDAMHDLTVPLTLAKALIQAEEAAAAKS